MTPFQIKQGRSHVDPPEAGTGNWKLADFAELMKAPYTKGALPI